MRRLFTPVGIEFGKYSFLVPIVYDIQCLQFSGGYVQQFRLCVDFLLVIQTEGFYKLMIKYEGSPESALINERNEGIL